MTIVIGEVTCGCVQQKRVRVAVRKHGLHMSHEPASEHDVVDMEEVGFLI